VPAIWVTLTAAGRRHSDAPTASSTTAHVGVTYMLNMIYTSVSCKASADKLVQAMCCACAPLSSLCCSMPFAGSSVESERGFAADVVLHLVYLAGLYHYRAYSCNFL
jgi:hypothetical protein